MKKLMENEILKRFLKIPAPGEIAKGKIIGREKSALFLDLGNFGTGIIYGEEFSQAKGAIRDLKIGDELAARVIKIDGKDGFVELSVTQAEEELAWLNLKERKDKNESFSIEIKKANKGGLITEIEGIAGFLPVSQLGALHYPKVKNGDTAEILRKLQKFIGKAFRVKIIALDPKQKSLILSEKAAIFEDRREVLKNYKVGDVVKGEITGIIDFGVFVKFPADKKDVREILEGFVHISELDWQLVRDPSEVVKIGEIVAAKITEIAGGRISLSLKALKKDPWQDLKYKKGEVVEGEVVKFNPFGAFVKIEPSILALCHISELKSEKEMKEALKIGRKYKFRISLMAPEDHKMILKLVP